LWVGGCESWVGRCEPLIPASIARPVCAVANRIGHKRARPTPRDRPRIAPTPSGALRRTRPPFTQAVSTARSSRRDRGRQPPALPLRLCRAPGRSVASRIGHVWRASPQKDLAPGCLLPPRVETERLKHERRPMERELALSQGPAPPRNHSSLAAIRTNDPQHSPCLRCGQSHRPQKVNLLPYVAPTPSGALRGNGPPRSKTEKRPNVPTPNLQRPHTTQRLDEPRNPRSSILYPPSSILYPPSSILHPRSSTPD
jgi:hypothetical protein